MPAMRAKDLLHRRIQEVLSDRCGPEEQVTWEIFMHSEGPMDPEEVCEDCSGMCNLGVEILLFRVIVDPDTERRGVSTSRLWLPMVEAVDAAIFREAVEHMWDHIQVGAMEMALHDHGDNQG